jgi:toxin ParE1/3/4
VNFEFHPLASKDYDKSINFYLRISNDLAKFFIEELESSIQKILLRPRSYPVIDLEIRRCLLNKFPYSILFSFEPGEIYILAIIHNSRKPNLWKTRLTNKNRSIK